MAKQPVTRLREEALAVLSKYPGRDASERILQMQTKIDTLQGIVNAFIKKWTYIHFFEKTRVRVFYILYKKPRLLPS